MKNSAYTIILPYRSIWHTRVVLAERGFHLLYVRVSGGISALLEKSYSPTNMKFAQLFFF